MKLLVQIAERLPEYRRLVAAVENGACPAALTGLSAVHRAHIAAALLRDTGRPVVAVCGDEEEGDRLSRDLAALTGREPRRLGAREFHFYPGATVSRQFEHRRLAALRDLAAGEYPLWVVTVEGLMQRTLPPAALAAAAFTLTMEGRYDLDGLCAALVGAGYTRCQQVEGVGQFAVRGGILDVFSPAYDQPVRLELWGEQIDSLGLFNPVDQRRTARLKEAAIIPAAEVLPPPGGGTEGPMDDRALPQVYPTLATAADYLPLDAVVCLCESARVAERGANYYRILNEEVKDLIAREILPGKGAVFARSGEELMARLSHWAVVLLDSFTTGTPPLPPRTLIALTAKQLPAYGLSADVAAADLEQYRDEKYGVVVLAGSEGRALNLQTLLRERKVRAAVDFQLHDLPGPGKIVIAVGGLSAGFEYPAAGVAVLTEGDGRAPRRPAKSSKQGRKKLESYADLAPGDLAVHEHHGVGRFVGMVKMQVDGVQKDYVKLSYAGADVLYVPATQLDLVSKYIGGGEDGESKKLSKLGGVEWEKTKTRAKKAARDLARGLIALYAQRQKLPGHAFAPDSVWQKEFEEEFDYTETDDQLRCIAEVKADMEKTVPMDRLLCGDVGYGKTEVALRAVMKCVLDGKQAAILVPTTVLARQHYLTALGRFSKYPVTVDVVSRFRTPAQMKETLRKVEQGSVDLLIGTHRLLQKDIRFKDLGLLVVDEEQRFGVTHKEKLKEMARQVDVLTLSATPIPRTLNMALSGIRDMSSIEEPPHNRRPVQTYVLEHDWSLLGDAMRRELERGGQVYYLHNRVETITRCAARIREMLGADARVAVAHGKMGQEEISDVMSAMTDGEVDVLVCTTIIETGIDLPNVNTLVIEDADKLGLAQLHQIRGRVGRSARRAHAYMTFRPGKVLTEVAAKRLSAIREYAEFGSGFKIAMRDLEIRGAGNVLGPEQSGFVMSVGYDMYLKLLEEAVLEEQGAARPRPAECSADLSVAAAIPEHYVPSPEQRMDLYRRIARIRSEGEADDLVDELIDRFGDPPRPVNDLVNVALLRAQAAGCGITEIAQKGALLNFYTPTPDMQVVAALCGGEQYRGRLLFAAGEKPCLSLRLKKGEQVLSAGRRLVEQIGALTAENGTIESAQ